AGPATTSKSSSPRSETSRKPPASATCERITAWRATTSMRTRRVCFSSWGFFRNPKCFSQARAIAGLADPGHSEAISLAQVSSTLGLLQTTLDNNVALQMILQLVDE